MEFWGIEVKVGKPLEVKPLPGQLVHISQASLGETPSKEVQGAKSITLRLKFDDKDLIIGSLKPEERTHVSFDLFFEKEFVLSHDWDCGSIYFTGYLVDDLVSDAENDDELEKDSPAPVEGASWAAIAKSKTKNLAAFLSKYETKKKKDTPKNDTHSNFRDVFPNPHSILPIYDDIELSQVGDSSDNDSSEEDMETSLETFRDVSPNLHSILPKSDEIEPSQVGDSQVGDSSDKDSSDEDMETSDDLQSLDSKDEEAGEEEEEEPPKVKGQQSKKRPADSAAPSISKKAKPTGPSGHSSASSFAIQACTSSKKGKRQASASKKGKRKVSGVDM